MKERLESLNLDHFSLHMRTDKKTKKLLYLFILGKVPERSIAKLLEKRTTNPTSQTLDIIGF